MGFVDSAEGSRVQNRSSTTEKEQRPFGFGVDVVDVVGPGEIGVEGDPHNFDMRTFRNGVTIKEELRLRTVSRTVKDVTFFNNANHFS